MLFKENRRTESERRRGMYQCREDPDPDPSPIINEKNEKIQLITSSSSAEQSNSGSKPITSTTSTTLILPTINGSISSPTHQNISQAQNTQATRRESSNEEKQFDMVYFLQKIIVDLNRSFDPNSLKDDHLRSLLLAEIIECQRNLLCQAQKNKKNNNKNHGRSSAMSSFKSTSSMSMLKDKNITLERIYDEWKVLAMVVDRICFFLYMFLLILMIAVIYFFNWLT